MKALYFGSTHRQLFGVFHPVLDDQSARHNAVLLCAPWLNEQNLTHRALRNLARSLASHGFPALRFDYFGTGDSAGDTGSAGPRDHAADVLVAARELAELSGESQVSVVGRGIGGLAALMAAEQHLFTDIVLWDPVLRGDTYVRRLRRLDWRQRLVRMQLPRNEDPGTLLGYPFPDRVREELASIDARELRPREGARCLLLVSRRDGEHDAFAQHLQSIGVRAQVEQVDDASQTGDVRAVDSALLASKPLVRIVEWLEERT